MAHNPFVVSGTLLNTTPGSGELVMLTSPPIIPPYDGAPILILACLMWNTGAGTTSVNYKIVRGTTTGLTNLMAAFADGIAAGVSACRTLMALDTAIGLAAAQYSLTITQNGNSGAGSATNGFIVAMCL
jgi:hypothetical protein